MTPLPPQRAMIVAHGQPSDPAPAEAALAGLARAVAALLPTWQITSATLAADGALAKGVSGPQGLVYPMFMAAGWFTASHLPERLAASGGKGWHILPPFGLDPAVQDLAIAIIADAATGPTLPAVLLAAHGSLRSPAPAELAFAMLRRLQMAGVPHAEAGFIDQSPRIADVAKAFDATALCLPFFAAEGGHVSDDLPAALAAGGFKGRVLPPLGLDPRVPALIAQALRAAATASDG